MNEFHGISWCFGVKRLNVKLKLLAGKSLVAVKALSSFAENQVLRYKQAGKSLVNDMWSRRMQLLHNGRKVLLLSSANTSSSAAILRDCGPRTRFNMSTSHCVQCRHNCGSCATWAAPAAAAMMAMIQLLKRRCWQSWQMVISDRTRMSSR